MEIAKNSYLVFQGMIKWVVFIVIIFWGVNILVKKEYSKLMVYAICAIIAIACVFDTEKVIGIVREIFKAIAGK